MNTASLRAPTGYHLPEAMKNCQAEKKDLFVKFGGHPCAAGFTIETQNISTAKALMTKNIYEQATNIDKTAKKYTHLAVPADFISLTIKPEIIWIQEKEIDNLLLEEIVDMDPFGQDFPMPNLCFQLSQKSIETKKWLGKEEKHIKLTSLNGFNVTFFNLETELKDFFLQKTRVFDTSNIAKLWVLTKPIQNAWNNKRSIELVVEKWCIDKTN